MSCHVLPELNTSDILFATVPQLAAIYFDPKDSLYANPGDIYYE